MTTVTHKVIKYSVPSSKVQFPDNKLIIVTVLKMVTKRAQQPVSENAVNFKPGPSLNNPQGSSKPVPKALLKSESPRKTLNEADTFQSALCKCLELSVSFTWVCGWLRYFYFLLRSGTYPAHSILSAKRSLLERACRGFVKIVF